MNDGHNRSVSVGMDDDDCGGGGGADDNDAETGEMYVCFCTYVSYFVQ
jgi:hypothetical protein